MCQSIFKSSLHFAAAMSVYFNTRVEFYSGERLLRDVVIFRGDELIKIHDYIYIILNKESRLSIFEQYLASCYDSILSDEMLSENDRALALKHFKVDQGITDVPAMYREAQEAVNEDIESMSGLY